MTREQINQTYQQTFSFCKDLLSRKRLLHGYELESSDNKTIETVLGDEKVVELLLKIPFDSKVYLPVLIEAIERNGKLFFPDKAKKRFLDINQINENLIIENGEEKKTEDNATNNLNLNEKINSSFKKLKEKDKKEALDKIELFKQLYPDGNIVDTNDYDVKSNLTAEQVIAIYKNVLFGIDKRFPDHFLSIQGDKRCALLVRFLFMEIYPRKPESLIDKNTLKILSQYKLGNVCRYFNYSLNRVLNNAWPNEIPLWYGGRIPKNYWENENNRIHAIRWLVEIKNGINPYLAGKITLKKADFIQSGLSYLLNNYFSSVGNAIRKAYPFIKPWQTGSIHAGYWNQKTASDAVRWLFDKLDKKPTDFADRTFDRKMFSRYGLGGLYENYFNCNIYKAVNCAWPGRYKEWEIKPLTIKYFRKTIKLKKYASWLLDKTNIPLNKALTLSGDYFADSPNFTAIKRFTRGNINNLFMPLLIEEQEEQKEIHLRQKWQNLIKKEKPLAGLQSLLLFGFYRGFVNNLTTQKQVSMQRMLQRNIRRRSIAVNNDLSKSVKTNI